MTTRHPLAQVFEQWGRVETAGTSPLYAALCEVIAQDPALLALAARSRPGQLQPNMLFGAVHLLLHRQPTARLAAWYPDLAGAAVRTDDPGPAFRAFCEEHRAALEPLLAQKRVQTNEVQRCLLLLPALALVAAEARRPLALLEIGASAGLLLHFDRYAYLYRGPVRTFVGEPRAAVRVETDLTGRLPSDLAFPRVAWRLGVDLHPLDPRSPEHREWLLALVWPEHADRRARLAAALDLAAARPPVLREGDATRDLAPLLAEAPPECALLVFHLSVLRQISPEGQAAIDAALSEASRSRDVWRFANDLLPHSRDRMPLTLCRYRAGRRDDLPLGEAPGHVQWLRWTHPTR